MKTIKDIEGKGRYLTIGIDSRLDIYIQLVIWKILDEFKLSKILENKQEEIDPFQIFELEMDPRKKSLHIKHKQEQPEYERDHVIKNVEVDPKKEYNGKIYIIDNEVNGMTMMWNTEY